MTVEELIQQQASKHGKCEVNSSKEQTADTELLEKIRETRDQSSQDPIFTILHNTGKVRMGSCTIEPF